MSLFKGICTALITPFDENDRINYDKLKELIDEQISAGVTGLVISGTTGEAPTILDDEKEELFKKSYEFIDGRACFIAGTGTNNTSHIIKLMEYAAKANADAVLINNPYYNKSSDEGIYKSYEAISDAVDMPIIVYNVPSRTGKNISADLAVELTNIKNVVAFKEASGDISQVADLLSKLNKIDKDVAVYSGNDDQILPVMSLGGLGAISTCSNIIPKKCLKITDAFFKGDNDSARESQFDILRMSDALFCECNPIPVKTAMNLIGKDVGDMRLPLVELTGEKREFLKKVLKEYSFELVME